MTLDPLDAAFVRRLSARPQPRPGHEPPRPAPRPTPISEAVSPPPEAVVSTPTPAARLPTVAPRATAPAAASTAHAERRRHRVPRHQETIAAAGTAARGPDHETAADPVVERLLRLAPEQWDALAGHVEAARLRGRRVIAVAGGRAGEGRTTLLRCLASALRGRGREVACALPHDLAVVADGPDGRGPTHDKRIILVDAGIWFPAGPIRRSLLQVASLGCDAAILVRRTGATGGLARQAALESLGIEVLGEVLTFTSSADDDLLEGVVAA